MKKLLLILLCLPFIGFGQNVNIPDANFKAYLVGNWAINTNGDTEIQVSEATVFNGSIYCQNLNISDLTGIEDFTSLNVLDCSYNQLTSLDISQNTSLIDLICWANQLTSLDVSGATALTNLDCPFNQLTSLDVSTNTNLIELDCYNNQLTSLDVSGATALTNLNCRINSLTTLDVNGATALINLNCSFNQLTSLDVSGATSLNVLDCSYNQLTSLDISQNTALTNLDCNLNQITSLDVSQNTALIILLCGANQLPSLDVSQNTALTKLECFDNQLTSLDVSQNTALMYLICQSNQLTSLDLRNGNNTNMPINNVSNNFTNNPDLYCIDVDNIIYSTTYWTVAYSQIDTWMSFSTDCSTAFGCTDNCAINYNSSAIIDDSSCTYPGSLLFTIACDSLTWNNNTYFTSGTYTDTSTYSNGCINIDSLELIINNSTSNSTNATACDSYTWIDGNTYNSNGTYTYLGYNLAGCQHTETLNLTINNSTSSAMSDTACGSYTWSTDGNTYTSSGIYTSTGTNSLGCMHTDSLFLTITINNVNLFATSSNVSCNGFIDGSLVATVTGGLSPYQYSLGGGLSQTSGTFSNLTAGTYSLDVTDINGCSSNQSIIITEPNPLFVNAFSTDVSCFGYCDGSTFSMPSGGTSPYSYLWSNGNITDNISALCAGAYVVNITDANNCVNTETVVISEPFLLSTSINVTDETAALNDGSANVIVLGGVSPYSYSWSNGSATNPNLNLSPGLYTLDVIDANGCIVSTSVTVNAYTPTDIIDIESASKNLRNITDMLGQETPYKRNTLLFYIYDDGTVDKKIIIE